MNKRRLLLIGGGVIVLLLGIVALIVSTRSDEPVVTTSKKAETSVVRIENVAEFSAWLNVNNMQPTEKALYAQVDRFTDEPEPAYKGTIREGSLKTSIQPYEGTPPADIPVVTFIVDIPDAQQSYVVQQSGGQGYPYNLVRIACPADNQLKYGTFGCVNEDQ